MENNIVNAEFAQQYEINAIAEMYEKNNNLTIFDIGAFTFGDSIQYKKYFPLSNIYAFEPDKTNLNNYAAYAQSVGINVVNVALSDEDGESTFYPSIGDHTCSGGIIKPVIVPGTKSQKGYHFEFDLDGYDVQTVRFDTFCKLNNIESVDYVHMDVQGAETKVINSLGNIRPKFIFAETCAFDEYETGTNFEQFNILMKTLGYKIHTRFTYDTLYTIN